MLRVVYQAIGVAIFAGWGWVHSAASVAVQGVGGYSGAGQCVVWWEFQHADQLPSFFVREVQKGGGIEVGFAQAEWREEAYKAGKGGVHSIRSLKKDHNGTPLLLFQIKLAQPQLQKLEKKVSENRFAVEWSCASTIASQWSWPLPPEPEAKSSPPSEMAPQKKTTLPKEKELSPLDTFYRLVSSEIVTEGKQKKGFVIQGSRRLVVKAEKSLLYSKPEIQASIVRPLNPGDTLFSPRKQGEWYVVDNGEREAYVAAADVRRLEELTPQDEEMLRRLVQRQMSNLTASGEKVSLREAEMVSEAVPDSTLDSTVTAPRLGKQIYRYSSFGRRDPFVPFEEPEIEGISIDEVQLVGIIWDSDTPLAIFEDVRVKGISYTLREGDEVLNGHVFKISQDEVIFLLTEFGVSRKFSMPLPRIIE